MTDCWWRHKFCRKTLLCNANCLHIVTWQAAQQYTQHIVAFPFNKQLPEGTSVICEGYKDPVCYVNGTRTLSVTWRVQGPRLLREGYKDPVCYVRVQGHTWRLQGLCLLREGYKDPVYYVRVQGHLLEGYKDPVYYVRGTRTLTWRVQGDCLLREGYEDTVCCRPVAGNIVGALYQKM